MRKFISLSILILSTALLFGQSAEKKIKSITQSVEKINADTGTYTSKMYRSSGPVYEIRGLYKDGQLRLMIYTNDLMTGQVVTEYYFIDNKLIYVHEKVDKWDPIKGASAKVNPIDSLFKQVKNIYDGKYYFWNEQLFDRTIKDERESKGSRLIVDNENKEKFILDKVKELTEQLSSNKVDDKQ